MPYRLVFLVLVFGLGLTLSSLSQVNTHGVPIITNHSSRAYKYHPKNFAAIQDNRGMMYFGNAYGILEFDGRTWRTIGLPNGKSAMSFAKDLSGKIFIGSVGDLGYLDFRPGGECVYKSLLESLPLSDRNFGEIWKTLVTADAVIFCSHEQIMVFKSNAFTTFRPSAKGMVFDYFDAKGNRFFCREAGKGLMELKDLSLTVVPSGGLFASRLIYHIDVIGFSKLRIFSDEGTGDFDFNTWQPMDTPLNSFITNSGVTCGVSLTEGYGVVGSVDDGVAIYNEQGNFIQHLNKNSGLASDNVLGLFKDRENNLWITTDNGISHVQFSSPFSTIGGQGTLEGMGYAAFILDEQLYLGTSKGLYARPWVETGSKNKQQENFKLIRNTEGQVWYLHEAEGVLLCGHTRGLFQVINGQATKISPGDYTGAWLFKIIRPGLLILGTYEGFEIYEKRNSQWSFRNRLEGFSEAARAFEIDHDGTIWMVHGNKGLFKIIPDQNYERVKVAENVSVKLGFEADYINDVSRINDQIIFAATHLLYVYNPASQKLEPFENWNRLIQHNEVISKISQHDDGNIWFINADRLEQLIRQKDGTYVRDSTTMRKLRGEFIGSYEFYWRYNASNYFIGTQNGFVHYDPTLNNTYGNFQTTIRSVELIANKEVSVFRGAFVGKEGRPELAQQEGEITEVGYDQNAIRFSYAALFYEDAGKTQYQYYLQRGSKGAQAFSSWTTAVTKEYSNLWEGNYEFHVRARNIHGQITQDAIYRFRILPPWFRTTTAYVAYFILTALIAMLVTKLVLNKIQRDRQRVERDKEREILLIEKQFAEESLKAEKEIILLQNQRLEADVRYKNDELTHLATNLSQKSEFLSQLKKELVALSSGNGSVNQSLSELIKTIEKGTEFDDHWDHFQTNFDTAHHNFLFKLREKFPALKPTDLLLCAYIRINKSNKEISSLLNISVSAVEKRRFRLREKMKLDDDTRLTAFLLEM